MADAERRNVPLCSVRDLGLLWFYITSAGQRLRRRNARWKHPHRDASGAWRAQEPFFRDYYYHHFYGLLCQKPLPQVTYQLPKSPEDIRDLVEVVKTRFAYIGQFPQVADSYHRIAELFALPHDCDAEFAFHINKLDSHKIVPDRRERFADAFRTSYELLSALGIAFPERT